MIQLIQFHQRFGNGPEINGFIDRYTDTGKNV